MTSLARFIYDDRPVRVVTIDGEPWFVGADVARVLGIAAASGITRMVDDEDKGSHEVETPGGLQSVTIVNESGLYTALMRSNNPAAKPFRRWITTEVLPSIRRHGGYLTPEATEAALTDPDFIIRLATDLKTARAERAAAEARAAELEAPAAAWGILVNAAGDYAVADAAKILSRDPSIEIGRDRLFTHMADARWIYRHEGRRPGWRAYQTQIDTGRLVEKANAAFQNSRTGEMEAAMPTIRITPKGLAALHKRLGGVEPLSPVGAVA